MTLTDEQIQDYIDGRLSIRERAVVAATLIANQELMHKVMRLVLINDIVRGVGEHVLDEPLPDAITQILKKRDDET